MENDPLSEKIRDLIASDKVEGAAVYNLDREYFGKVHNFMVGKVSGKIGYVIISFGGVLCVGEHYFPIRWEHLHFDSELNGFVVDIEPEQLDVVPELSTPFGRDTDDYYSAGLFVPVRMDV